MSVAVAPELPVNNIAIALHQQAAELILLAVCENFQVVLANVCAQCSAFLLPCFGFRDPLVTRALLFPLSISLLVLIFLL
jgi:hypothetical protein